MGESGCVLPHWLLRGALPLAPGGRLNVQVPKQAPGPQRTSQAWEDVKLCYVAFRKSESISPESFHREPRTSGREAFTCYFLGLRGWHLSEEATALSLLGEGPSRQRGQQGVGSESPEQLVWDSPAHSQVLSSECRGHRAQQGVPFPTEGSLLLGLRVSEMLGVTLLTDPLQLPSGKQLGRGWAPYPGMG